MLLAVCFIAGHNVTSTLSVTAMIYSINMRIFTVTSKELQVPSRERALNEKIMKDPIFVMQVGGHLGSHNRAGLKCQAELVEEIELAKKNFDRANAELELCSSA